MKLSIPLIFQSGMVLQRHKPINVWGESVDGDTITLKLDDETIKTQCTDGKWSAQFSSREACLSTKLIISSEKTSEQIEISDVAVGEVFLAGGQSNMEFIIKYDKDFETTKALPDDEYLRYFAYPQVPFDGFLEKEGLGKFGIWRKWDSEENRREFSAIAAYMALDLREKLDVPIGILACNWGGTPACAWTDKDIIYGDYDTFKVIVDWENQVLKDMPYEQYMENSEKKLPPVSKEMQDFQDYWMMGGDMTEFFKQGPPPLTYDTYTTYLPGPRSAVFTGNLYENMLKKVAPYTMAAFLWYQGEDDDARDRQDCYEKSMAVMIENWRQLFNDNLPFYQIELAPFRGIGVTGAKKYDLLREKQYISSLLVDDVYEVCILDVGEEFNIHPRNKKTVGHRLANMVLKHNYGYDDKIADCPRIKEVRVLETKIECEFDNCNELSIKNSLDDVLKLEGFSMQEYETEGNKLIIKGEKTADLVTVEYCYDNYCVASLFNEEENPAFGFRKDNHED